MAYVMDGSDIDRACVRIPSAFFDWLPCDVCGDDYGIHERLVFDTGQGAKWRVQECDRSGPHQAYMGRTIRTGRPDVDNHG